MEKRAGAGASAAEAGRRPRLLSLITSLSTGGAEILLEGLTPLFEREVDTLTVSLRPLGDVGRRMREAGCAVASCEMALKYDPQGPARLWRLIAGFRPDILHSHLVHANLLGRILGKAAGVPVEVSSIHNERFDNRWEYESLRATDHLTTYDVCIGRQVAVAMLEAGVAHSRKLRVVPNGVDASRFHPARPDRVPPWSTWGFSAACAVFGFVGRLEPQKDIHNLLAAARILDGRGVPVGFVVVGDGSSRRALEAESASLGLGAGVRFAGSLDAVPAVLRTLDAFVLPSAWEGLPLAVLEAMASGLPIVSTRVGSVPDLVGDGVGGLLVAPADSRALAEAVSALVSDPRRARRMGLRNRRLVEERHSLEANAATLLALYRGALPASGTSS